MSDLWGFESIPQTQRARQPWEELPGIVAAVGGAYNNAKARELAYQQHQEQMAMKAAEMAAAEKDRTARLGLESTRNTMEQSRINDAARKTAFSELTEPVGKTLTPELRGYAPEEAANLDRLTGRASKIYGSPETLNTAQQPTRAVEYPRLALGSPPAELQKPMPKTIVPPLKGPAAPLPSPTLGYGPSELEQVRTAIPGATQAFSGKAIAGRDAAKLAQAEAKGGEASPTERIQEGKLEGMRTMTGDLLKGAPDQKRYYGLVGQGELWAQKKLGGVFPALQPSPASIEHFTAMENVLAQRMSEIGGVNAFRSPAAKHFIANFHVDPTESLDTSMAKMRELNYYIDTELAARRAQRHPGQKSGADDEAEIQSIMNGG